MYCRENLNRCRRDLGFSDGDGELVHTKETFCIGAKGMGVWEFDLEQKSVIAKHFGLEP